ncbi:hypothetical protein [Methylocystis sp. SC2]|uniref:hypothetical protein n=1 Tax=Methylocystis sp. (strain SC2) TaxID=187303 RepID=UPI001FCB01D0|nr:hypothetical protein [Methylocystis sp. SC2]
MHFIVYVVVRAGRTTTAPDDLRTTKFGSRGRLEPVQTSAFVAENARVAAWPGLIIVGFADSVAIGAFLVAVGRVDASSAAASANEIDAKAIDLSKKAHFI